MPEKKQIAKAYEKYSEKFTPKPKYFKNSFKAFLTGGAICVVSLWAEKRFIAAGASEKNAAAYVVMLTSSAQAEGVSVMLQVSN